MNFRPPEIWLISGPSRTDRNALARRVGERLGNAAHIDGEALWDQLVADRATPEVDEAEADRQYELSIRNQCLLARSYAEAGFTPVLDFPVATSHHLEAYQNYLVGAHLRLAVIDRPDSIDGAGVEVAADATADAVLALSEDALLRRV